MLIDDVKVELKKEVEGGSSIFVSVGVGMVMREGEEVIEFYLVVRYVNFVYIWNGLFFYWGVEFEFLFVFYVSDGFY